MKILELDLRAFGPFTNAKLDLAEGREGMHILYGPNEAGKSSALRALKCLLYGIPKNSADNFIHENKTLRIGGRLRNADGAEFDFLRRKGNKDTVLSPDGEAIDEELRPASVDAVPHGAEVVPRLELQGPLRPDLEVLARVARPGDRRVEEG